MNAAKTCPVLKHLVCGWIEGGISGLGEDRGAAAEMLANAARIIRVKDIILDEF